MKIYIVSATRFGQEAFHAQSALATSLKPFLSEQVRMVVAYANREGLPAVYNRVVDTLVDVGEPDDVFLFVHDDVSVLDFYWIDRVLDGLSRYAVVGLAGNSERLPFQPSWLFSDAGFSKVNMATLSGMVGHGKGFPLDQLAVYGSPDREVELLDGLFLGCRLATLRERGLRFDERFDFHFYDLDFCRQAKTLGLNLGTVGVSVMHQSAGNLGSDAWRLGYQRYLLKWQS